MFLVIVNKEIASISSLKNSNNNNNAATKIIIKAHANSSQNTLLLPPLVRTNDVLKGRAKSRGYKVLVRLAVLRIQQQATLNFVLRTNKESAWDKVKNYDNQKCIH